MARRTCNSAGPSTDARTPLSPARSSRSHHLLARLRGMRAWWVRTPEGLFEGKVVKKCNRERRAVRERENDMLQVSLALCNDHSRSGEHNRDQNAHVVSPQSAGRRGQEWKCIGRPINLDAIQSRGEGQTSAMISLLGLARMSFSSVNCLTMRRYMIGYGFAGTCARSTDERVSVLWY
jgi:hypothetical protein